MTLLLSGPGMVITLMVDAESNVMVSENVNEAGTNRKHIFDVDVLS